MAKFLDRLDDRLTEFIREQPMFFVATAPSQGRVNLSPKGMDTFRVLGPDHVGYLDLTGSGNETAAHLLENGRLTFMFCAFSGAPLILRLYGKGNVVGKRDTQWSELRTAFGPEIPGERQLVMMRIESVQTSCGFGVPHLQYIGDREQLVQWAVKKGPEGLENYRTEKNRTSIDGAPTGI